MVVTPSEMTPLGAPLPQFSLLDVVTQKVVSEKDVVQEKGLIVVFLCAHCPFVQHVLPALKSFGAWIQTQGIGCVAISSNDVVAYPQDSPQHLATLGLPFPCLFDETQEIAKAFRATCTPDFFLYDKNSTLVYRGEFDDTRPGKGVATGDSLRKAVAKITAGTPIEEDEQRPSVGCSIKWKA